MGCFLNVHPTSVTVFLDSLIFLPDLLAPDLLFLMRTIMCMHIMYVCMASIVFVC